MFVLSILKIRDVKTPERGTASSSGIDFFVPNNLEWVEVTPKTNPQNCRFEKDGSFKIHPGEGLLIPTGIKTVIQPGYDLVFDNKSGVAVKKGLVVGANVVDSDYRGECHIHVINTSKEVQTISAGDKIVQAIVRKVILDLPEEISEEDFNALSNTERGEGGFGSTWTK